MDDEKTGTLRLSALGYSLLIAILGMNHISSVCKD